MKVHVIGSTGMAGQALIAEASRRSIEVSGSARENSDYNVDISNHSLFKEMLAQIKADIIINTAACVNLVDCENNPGMAYCVNARPAAAIAEHSRQTGCYYVQISTDHFFTGDQDRKHSETEPIKLLNEYARTKYLGEVMAAKHAESLIVRTNIVGFRNIPSRPTFVEWAIGALSARQPMFLYNDFYTSSIDVVQFARALFDLIEKRVVGVINLASSEVSSKEKFIRALARRFNFDIKNATTGSVTREKDVLRAESLGLDVARAESILGYRMPVLEEVIEQLYIDSEIGKESMRIYHEI